MGTLGSPKSYACLSLLTRNLTFPKYSLTYLNLSILSFMFSIYETMNLSTENAQLLDIRISFYLHNIDTTFSALFIVDFFLRIYMIWKYTEFRNVLIIAPPLCPSVELQYYTLLFNTYNKMPLSILLNTSV